MVSAGILSQSLHALTPFSARKGASLLLTPLLRPTMLTAPRRNGSSFGMTYGRVTRQRVIADLWAGYSLKWIAKQRYSPSLSTVRNWVVWFLQTGSYGTPHCGSRNREGVVKRRHLEILIDHLRHVDATLYLDEMQRFLITTCGRKYGISRIHAALLRRKITRKKLSLIAQQQNAYERHCHMQMVRLHFEAGQIICVDETRKDARLLMRDHGYGPRDERVNVVRHYMRGFNSISAMGVMSLDGMVDAALHEARGINSATFFDDCVNHIIPHTNPFPGPNSVVFIDNAIIHWSAEVLELFRLHGVILHHLPAYGYDLMPIEKAFSKAVAWLRRHESVVALNPRAGLRRALYSVTSDDAAGYYRSCGIDVLEVAPGVYM